jgi:hypothetical protein
MKNEPRIEFTPLFTKQRKSAPVEIKEAFLDTPTVSLNVISLVASSCGYYRGHIEQHAAQ